MRRLITTTLSLLLIASTASAQTKQKQTLTIDGAKKVIAAAVAEAKKDSAATAAIAVVDDGGNTIAVERLDNTFAAGANISVGKARTAALFKKPTRFFEDVINKGRTAMTTVDFTPLQGGVPIIVDGQIVGAIGVSGAASAQRDEEVAIAGANALSSAATAQVSYYQSDTVASAFAKGTILFENAATNYAVHASRRDKAGEVEIHTTETDVIYVIDGKATFVTGGQIVDPRQTAPEQIRGRDVTGGETRSISRGDVIIVPAGTPHWFKQIDSPLQYYVVKVIG
jgi:glc operon protein GlcG